MTKKNKNKPLLVLTNALGATKYPLRRFAVCLSLWLLPSLLISIGATPTVDWRKNMKVGLEILRGVPYGALLKEKATRDRLFGADVAVDGVETSYNGLFGVTVGYSFPFWGNALAIGPEVRLLVGTRSKVEISQARDKFSYQDQSLHIPLALKLTTYKQETGVRESGLILGYEFRVSYAPRFRQTAGSPDDAIQSALKGAESIAKSLKRGGSAFLEGRVAVYKGCYLTGRLKFPTTDHRALEEAKQTEEENERAVHSGRILRESLVEIGVGVNIMKWFLSDV